MTKLDLTLREEQHPRKDDDGLRYTMVGDVCSVSTIRLWDFGDKFGDYDSPTRGKYETLVQGGPWDGETNAYNTKEDAIAGHDYLVADIVNSLEVGHIPTDQRLKYIGRKGWEMSEYSSYVAIDVGGGVTVAINKYDEFVLVSTYRGYLSESEKIISQAYVNTKVKGE